LISFQGVSFSYFSREGEPTFTLDDITFTIPRGTYAALIGPNGSGKTTIAKMIKGLVSPDSGSIEVAGKMVEHENLSDDVGLVFSNPENQIVSAIVEEDIAFGLENLGVDAAEMRRRISAVMEKLGLTHLAKMLPHNLSGGEQQRLVIAGVLVMGLSVLVLDEATSMLDSRGRRDILTLIRELNRNERITVVSITHSLIEAVLADTILVLDGGRIVFEGTPKEFLFDDDILYRLKIELPEFLKLLRFFREEDIDLPHANLGVGTIVDALAKNFLERSQ
jgi:energy-coupling factor transporter ATPase